MKRQLCLLPLLGEDEQEVRHILYILAMICTTMEHISLNRSNALRKYVDGGVIYTNCL